MAESREKITQEIAVILETEGPFFRGLAPNVLAATDRILAIPEIRDALARAENDNAKA